jgi:hypothetical protein
MVTITIPIGQCCGSGSGRIRVILPDPKPRPDATFWTENLHNFRKLHTIKCLSLFLRTYVLISLGKLKKFAN